MVRRKTFARPPGLVLYGGLSQESEIILGTVTVFLHGCSYIPISFLSSVISFHKHVLESSSPNFGNGSCSRQGLRSIFGIFVLTYFDKDTFWKKYRTGIVYGRKGSSRKGLYTVKKLSFFQSPAWMSLTKIPLDGNNLIIR